MERINVIQSVFLGNQPKMKPIFLLLLPHTFLAFSFSQGQVEFPDNVLDGNQSFVTERGTNNTEEIELEAAEAANSFNSLERIRRYRIVLVVQPTGECLVIFPLLLTPWERRICHPE